MKKHKHIFTPWLSVDKENIVEYRLCEKCGKVEFKGNYSSWLRRYK